MVPHDIHLLRLPDGSHVVEVTLDLTGEQLHAGAHAVRQVVADRYRIAPIESGDDVQAMRELTLLADELESIAVPGARSRATLTVAATGRLRGALEDFAASRAEGALREGDAEALPAVHAMIDGVADAHAAAVRAALDGGVPARRG